jgi:WD40 repeat protein
VNTDISTRHGRDNKLLVWQLRESDEADFSKLLPIEDTTSHRKQPWLLHTLDVNALNFCSFAMCQMPTPSPTEPTSSPSPQQSTQPSILIAVPGVQDGLINITALPSTTRYATIPPPKDTSTGMLMAVSLLSHQPPNSNNNPTTSSALLVAAGYESGHIALWHLIKPSPTTKTNEQETWQTLYLTKPHSQPVLSLALVPTLGAFFSSSADAIIAKHPLDGLAAEPKTLQTRHAGQQSLVVRGDGKIFATAGWDGRVRVYAAKGGMRELAVLKWHKEGCYAAAFAEVLDGGGGGGGGETGVDDGTGEAAAGRGQALTVSQQRLARSKATHWLAAGSKDGRVSLWDIY